MRLASFFRFPFPTASKSVINEMYALFVLLLEARKAFRMGDKDQDDFSTALQQLQRLLRNYVRRIIGQQSYDGACFEDVASEIIVDLLRRTTTDREYVVVHAGSLKKTTTLPTRFKLRAKEKIAKLQKRRQKQRSIPLDTEIVDHRPARIERQQEEEQFAHLVDELATPELPHEVLTAIVNGESKQDIAQVLSVTARTVRNRLHRLERQISIAVCLSSRP